MNVIRIRKKIDSETLHLPELGPLVGQTVEITVAPDEACSVIQPGTGDWAAAEQAAKELRETGYDFDAWREQREYDLKQADEPLP